MRETVHSGPIKTTNQTNKMNGTILFENVTSLAQFLRSFEGSTALFRVEPNGEGYLLTFTGSY